MADHNLRASGYAIYGTSVYGQEQYGGHVRSEVEVSQPLLVKVLSADNTTTNSEVATPTLEQNHSLLSVSVTTNSEVTTSTLEQVHNLLSVSVSSNCQVTTPTIDQIHVLDATDAITGGEGGALSIDNTYGTTYLIELTSFPSTFSSGSGGSGQIDVTWVFDMTFSTTDTGCILDQGGNVDGTYVGMVSGGNLRLSTSGAVPGVSNATSTTTTDMSAYAGVAGQLIVTIDYQNHIQCWWNDSTNNLNQIVSVDYNADGDWAGPNVGGVGQGSNVQGGQSESAFTGTLTKYREFNNNYVDLSSVSTGGTPNETSSPSVTQDHNLLPVSLSSNSEVINPDLDELNILDANDVSSVTTLIIPSISQVHNVSPVSVEANAEFNSPELNESHTLLATSFSTNAEVSSPDISENNELLSVSVETSSETLATNITQLHVVTSVLAEADAETDQATITQLHVLDASDTEVNTTTSTVGFNQLHVLEPINVTSGVSQVNNPDVDELNILDAEDISSSTALVIPFINQLHNISANDLETSNVPETSSPDAVIKIIFLADSVESTTPEVSSPTAIENNNLNGVSVETDTETNVVSIAQYQVLTATTTQTNTETASATILQLHVVNADDIISNAETSLPIVTQLQVLGAEDISVTPEVTSALARNLEPIDQDTRFTIHIPSENKVVTVAPQDYSNNVLVLHENRNLLILADRIAA